MLRSTAVALQRQAACSLRPHIGRVSSSSISLSSIRSLHAGAGVRLATTPTPTPTSSPAAASAPVAPAASSSSSTPDAMPSPAHIPRHANTFMLTQRGSKRANSFTGEQKEQKAAEEDEELTEEEVSRVEWRAEARIVARIVRSNLRCRVLLIDASIGSLCSRV